jgi:hypothetical protein
MLDHNEFMNEHITGNAFAALADVVVDRMGGVHGSVEKSCVVFCQTNFLPAVCDLLRGYPKNKYILITHWSDFPIDGKRYSYKPDNVVKWYAQNVAIDRFDLIPIPLGLEGNGCQGRSDRPEVLYEIMQKDRKLENIVYVNASRTTNQKRCAALDYFAQFGWATCKANVPFEEYIQDLHNHLFVVSPEGNGMDCHRTWEALYMGAIPIVQRSIMTESFADLPIIIVDDFTEISLLSLLEYDNGDCVDKLKMSYWHGRIKNECL